MADATKVCKICGRTYPYCRSLKTADGVFRWQDVACCPEHGSEYLAAVLKSRGIASEEEPQKTVKRTSRARRTVKDAEASVADTTASKEESND